jgi:hypothetical protein
VQWSTSEPVFFNLKPGPELRDAILLVATLGGGTSGALLSIRGLSLSDSRRETLAILLLCAVYGLGVWAGVSLHRHAAKWTWLTALYLAFQIPVVQSAALTYKLWAVAAYAFLYFPTSVAFGTDWFIGTYGELTTFGPAREIGIGINVVPIALLSLLFSKHS